MNNKKQLTLSILIALSSNAYADETDLKEVTVTANKMEQYIEDVPTSISVISDIDIEDKEMSDITDVVKEVPNMTYHNAGYVQSSNFRGLNASLFTYTNPVVLYVDGIPQSSVNGYVCHIQLIALAWFYNGCADWYLADKSMSLKDLSIVYVLGIQGIIMVGCWVCRHS